MTTRFFARLLGFHPENKMKAWFVVALVAALTTFLTAEAFEACAKESNTLIFQDELRQGFTRVVELISTKNKDVLIGDPDECVIFYTVIKETKSKQAVTISTTSVKVDEACIDIYRDAFGR